MSRWTKGRCVKGLKSVSTVNCILIKTNPIRFLNTWQMFPRPHPSFSFHDSHYCHRKEIGHMTEIAIGVELCGMQLAPTLGLIDSTCLL